MKKGIVMLLFLICQNLYSININDNRCFLYIEVDVLPQFQMNNGENIMEYIYSNLKYPEEADIEGTVIVSFVVDKSGNVKNVKKERGLHEICDNEVKKVLQNMPRWKGERKTEINLNIYEDRKDKDFKDIGLTYYELIGHELKHSYDMQFYKNTNNEKENKTSEYHTVNFENLLRKEKGRPIRTRYGIPIPKHMKGKITIWN